MFTLNDLPKIVFQGKKRVGRGNGSQRGKNCGKGNKGQLSRGGKMPVYFSGTTSDSGPSILSRNPKKRGFKALPKRQEVQLALTVLLKNYKNGETVSMESLLHKNLISKKINKVRVYLSKKEEKVEIKFDNSDKIHLTKGVKELVK